MAPIYWKLRGYSGTSRSLSDLFGHAAISDSVVYLNLFKSSHTTYQEIDAQQYRTLTFLEY